MTKLTKEMILQGLLKGVVKIIQNPNDDCISCQIGDFWFYFIGMEHENLTPKEVYEIFNQEELAYMIFNEIMELDKVEINYYTSWLSENLT